MRPPIPTGNGAVKQVPFSEASKAETPLLELSNDCYDKGVLYNSKKLGKFDC